MFLNMIVTVFYQDPSQPSISKPKISDTPAIHGPQAFKEILSCQGLFYFHKSDIPKSYKVDNELNKTDKTDAAQLKDLAWSLSRIGVTENQVSAYSQTQRMSPWSAGSFMWTEESVPVKIFAFYRYCPIQSHSLPQCTQL